MIQREETFIFSTLLSHSTNNLNLPLFNHELPLRSTLLPQRPSANKQLINISTFSLLILFKPKIHLHSAFLVSFLKRRLSSDEYSDRTRSLRRISSNRPPTPRLIPGPGARNNPPSPNKYYRGAEFSGLSSPRN